MIPAEFRQIASDNPDNAKLLLSNGIKVSEKQFPQIFECVKEFSERLGLQAKPDICIVGSNIQNWSMLLRQCPRHKSLIRVNNAIVFLTSLLQLTIKIPFFSHRIVSYDYRF
jgi:hypothetical protein